MEDVTQMLKELRSGNLERQNELYRIVYPELKKIAYARMKAERTDHTLQATGLVSEAFIRLVKQRNFADADRHYFYGIAADLMYKILVDYARKPENKNRDRDKNIETLQLGEKGRPVHLLELDWALKKLEEVEAELARLIKMKYVGGLTYEEISEVCGRPVGTIKKKLAEARAFLFSKIS